MTLIGKSDVVTGTVHPRWDFTCEHVFTLRHGSSKGWLVVEVADWDRVGEDEPMGCVIFDLSNLAEDDQLQEGWYPLTWVPGQQRVAPQGEVYIRYLLSTATEGLHRRDKDWLLESFDIANLVQEIEYFSASSRSPRTLADKSRLEWRLHAIVQQAFSIFDVDGDGAITATELHHVMACFGETLSDDEIGQMIVSADGYANGAPRDHIILRDDGQECSISAKQFEMMMTQYLGSRSDPSLLNQTLSASKLRVQSAGVCLQHPPKPGNRPVMPEFMDSARSSHTKLPSEKRLPSVFWFFLRHNMEHLLMGAQAHGVKDVQLFRRDIVTHRNADSGTSCSVRNTESKFSITWDLMQVLILCCKFAFSAVVSCR